ncbi:hypothetical protein [Pseudarthrobacter albicanus]|uniref:hypothetical protein n=1 Tax=Pseudarthrobacter albicanus TaxID=2823873 RepID=UPI001BA50984|nr:hypothetical protein [Pseudarthrobacter albicanus]
MSPGTNVWKPSGGRDTTEFVALVAATASACAACGLALQPKERLSLVVDITEGRDGDGIEYLTLDTGICHRRCREPDLTLRTAAGAPDDLTARGARLILGPRDGSGLRPSRCWSTRWSRS